MSDNDKTTCGACLGPATIIKRPGFGRTIRCDGMNKVCGWYVNTTPDGVEIHRARYDANRMA